MFYRCVVSSIPAALTFSNKRLFVSSFNVDFSNLVLDALVREGIKEVRVRYC